MLTLGRLDNDAETIEVGSGATQREYSRSDYSDFAWSVLLGEVGSECISGSRAGPVMRTPNFHPIKPLRVMPLAHN